MLYCEPMMIPLRIKLNLLELGCFKYSIKNTKTIVFVSAQVRRIIK